VILYGGGTKGDEPEVVATMRLGNELHGAVLTSVGIAEIEKSVYAVSIPMAYDSYEEAYAVLDRLRPRLEAAIDAKGFVMLNWADAGWIHFFSTKPVAAGQWVRGTGAWKYDMEIVAGATPGGIEPTATAKELA
jgi:TRAP-type C4-dicarboxylate transport system substrate-binding protein